MSRRAGGEPQAGHRGVRPTGLVQEAGEFVAMLTKSVKTARGNKDRGL